MMPPVSPNSIDGRGHRREEEFVLLDQIHALRLSASRRAERGESKLKAILFTIILVLLVYSAFKIVPIYVQNYQLNDKMQETARFAVVNRYNEEQIRDTIFKEIQSLEIPAKREDIKVSSSPALVRISVDYSVPVDLLFYHMDLHFTPSSENKSIL
jgi:predicted membrane protein